MPKPNDSDNAPVDTPELLSTQSILQTLATDPDVGKLREAHPELTDESVRAALRDAATWAASDFVEPTLREKALNLGWAWWSRKRLRWFSSWACILGIALGLSYLLVCLYPLLGLFDRERLGY